MPWDDQFGWVAMVSLILMGHHSLKYESTSLSPNTVHNFNYFSLIANVGSYYYFFLLQVEREWFQATILIW